MGIFEGIAGLQMGYNRAKHDPIQVDEDGIFQSGEERVTTIWQRDCSKVCGKYFVQDVPASKRWDRCTQCGHYIKWTAHKFSSDSTLPKTRYHNPGCPDSQYDKEMIRIQAQIDAEKAKQWESYDRDRRIREAAEFSKVLQERLLEEKRKKEKERLRKQYLVDGKINPWNFETE